MPYYRRCPICGAALDPGERCGCTGPVFRVIGDHGPEDVSQKTFSEILQDIRRGSQCREKEDGTT